MALAVVMIYQAIDHLNFAQGEMAMFSTFIAWQLLQWGLPYWAAFVLTIGISFVAGVLIERIVFKPIQNRSEEHTSELQSRQYLVCRLLLEKKKAHAASVCSLS